MPLTRPLNSTLPIYLLSWSTPESPKSGSQNSLKWNLEEKTGIPWSRTIQETLPTFSLSEDANCILKALRSLIITKMKERKAHCD